MQLELFSESVSPNGNIQAPGIINQLGRPNLDPITILVREAVQNSWDARANNNQTVNFSLSGWSLNDKQLGFLRKAIFLKRPQNHTLPLDRVLSENVDVLAIYDHGTLGLGGPTRADIITGNKEARDFVDFLRNVGQPSDREHTGGTYGYGKAAFYMLSKAQTILVYTRCFFNGRYQSRLMASALGNSFIQKDKAYTGRHWWGQLIKGIVEPIFDEKADEFAKNLGMRIFSTNESGTTVLIIAPNFNSEKISDQLDLFHNKEGRSPFQALNFAAESILWYFWPKMVGEKPAMKFSVSWQGNEISIPSPENYPPLKGFIDSMTLLKQGKSPNCLNHHLSQITSQKPTKIIGQLALHMFQISRGNIFETHYDDAEKFSGLTHHTAIMRQPELVVKYISGPILTNEWFGYGGVFISQKDEDEIFANSEPPTHDNWVAESLTDRKSRTIVRVALRNIAAEMDNFAKPASATNSQGILVPLGSFANELGKSLLTSVIGNAATTSFPIEYVRNPYQQKPKTVDNNHGNQIAPPQDSLIDAQSTIGTPFDGTRIKDPFTTNAPEAALPGDKGNKPINGETSTAAWNSIYHIGKAKVQTLPDGEYVLVDEVAGLNIRFILQPGENSLSTLVEVKTFAIVDGDQIESEPPIGGSSSSVLCWIAPDGTKYKGSENINIPVEVEGEWQVIVSVPEDIMVGVDIRVEARGN